MANKFIKAAASSMIALTMLVGCGSSTDSTTNSGQTIGMVTDLGSIDDKSFNQLTWEGIEEAAAEFGTGSKYLKPNSNTEAEYLNQIANLYDAGIRLIITPGHTFGTTIYEAQNRYPDADFVILDSVVHSGDFVPAANDNAVSVLFEEQEAGFLAGLAAGLQLKEGEAGFIGGMETEAIQKFNYGYQQGIQYSNDNYGTNVTVDPANFIYQGTFTDVAAGQQIAAQMYDRGVDVIFSAAGGVGTGVIKEARERAEKGEEVWVIGVDADQYEDGVYADGKSVILTSAMKKVDKATYDMIAAYLQNNFPGGSVLSYGIANDGVGLPAENPNLSEEVVTTINTIYDQIKNGEIVVAAEGEGLIP